MIKKRLTPEQIVNIQDLKSKGISSESIAALVGTSIRSVQRYANKILDQIEDQKGPLFKTSTVKGEHRVLVIPDIHCPASDLKYVDFLKKLYADYKCDTVVFLGDLVDSHAISSHPKSTLSKGTVDEYDEALKMVEVYTKSFPNAKYCLGNHDKRIMRQAATLGIPEAFLKSFRELYKIPDTWEIADSFIIDDVLYIHGTEYCSRNGFLNVSNSTHMSTVLGHCHTNFGIVYSNSGYKKIFTLYAGCLIDTDAYNFEYGKTNKFKPYLGAAVVLSSTEAYTIPYKEG